MIPISVTNVGRNCRSVSSAVMWDWEGVAHVVAA